MAIELITKYATAVDELFKAESKRQLVTNTDYDFINAHTVKIYKVTTAKMNDYNRVGTSNNYGEPETLEATTEQFTLSRDRSFTYVLDRLDADETGNALNATTSLARQLREVVIPEIDTWIYKTMSEQAGTTATATLTSDNIYNEILTASEVLDNAEVPEQERCIIVTPSIYTMMKQNSSIVMQTEAGAETRKNGVVAMLDGISVIKVPSNRLPEKCGFIVCHKSATVAPYKLEDYKAHDNPPGINGYLCEGRFVYDAKVLDNKAMGVYYHTV